MVNIIVNNNKIEDVQLVIFDKDGTLIELYNYWSNMIRYRAELICEKLGLNKTHERNLMYEMGVDLNKKCLRPNGPVGIKKREIVMQAAIDYLASINNTDELQLCFNIFRDVDKYSLNKFNEIIKPINGCYDLIHNLKKSNCKIAIATTDQTERAKLAIEFLGVSENIDFIVGVNNVKNNKPAPDMIELIIEKLGIKKSNTVMVGDAITDIQMGINANIGGVIGVCSGLTAREKLEKMTEHVVNDISEIKVSSITVL